MKLEEEKVRRDIRLLEWMILRIKGYRNNFVHVGDLISGLESYLRELETINEEWGDEFFDNWLTLEVTFAVALAKEEQGEPVDEEEDKKIILSTLDVLEKMVLEKLEEVKKLVPEQEEEFDI